MEKNGVKLPSEIYDYCSFGGGRLSNIVFGSFRVPMEQYLFLSRVVIINPKVKNIPRYTKFENRYISCTNSAYINGDVVHIGDFIITVSTRGKISFCPISDSSKNEFDSIMLNSF